MTTKFSVALTISVLGLVAASGPMTMAEESQALSGLSLPESTSNEHEDVIKQIIEPQVCWKIAGGRRICFP